MSDKKIFFILIGIMALSLTVATLYYGLVIEKYDLSMDNIQEVVSSDTEVSDETQTDEGEDEIQTSEEQGEVPDFTVYDRDGNEVHLSDFVGKPVVLNFWASWCSPCKKEMPYFDALYCEYGDQIHFVMVNATDGYQETMESALEYLDGTEYKFPVYFDSDSDAITAYGVSAFPTTFFFDASGNPVAYGQGSMDEETLEKGLKMILPQ